MLEFLLRLFETKSKGYKFCSLKRNKKTNVTSGVQTKEQNFLAFLQFPNWMFFLRTITSRRKFDNCGIVEQQMVKKKMVNFFFFFGGRGAPCRIYLNSCYY